MGLEIKLSYVFFISTSLKAQGNGEVSSSMSFADADGAAKTLAG